MPILANAWPPDFKPGWDFVQIEDEGGEFVLASEPSGLIAVEITDRGGYLSVEAAKRLHAALTHAIANSEAPRPEFEGVDHHSNVADDDLPF